MINVLQNIVSINYIRAKKLAAKRKTMTIVGIKRYNFCCYY